ncbi:hypothetical protein AB2T90_19460, partial [Clostridium butyricum]|uniref:hypothetical protein n=1 Tax=Clostridium butyricum TaxID=1492 RepID=UPI0034B02676
NISIEGKEIEEYNEDTKQKEKVKTIDYKKYKLSWDEELALTQIDLAKEELISQRREGNNINYKYDLPPDKKNKMHDDRCYTFVMLAWHLKNLRREGLINKIPQSTIDVSSLMQFNAPQLRRKRF